MSDDLTNAASTATCQPLTSAQPLRLQVIGTARNGQIVEVASSRVTIGSGPKCTLRLRAPGVQPFHCLIVREPTGTFARALSGETLLNGEKFREELLQPGDRLRVGYVELQICDSADPQPVPSQPSMTAEHPSGYAPNLNHERMGSNGLLERIERIEQQVSQLRASDEDRPSGYAPSAEAGLVPSITGEDTGPRPAFDEEAARLAQECQELASQLAEAKAQHTAACQTISQLEFERDELFRRCELQDSEAEQVRAEYDRALSGERLTRAELESRLEGLVSKVAELESQTTALQSDLAFAQSAIDVQRSDTENSQAELERTRIEVLQWQTEANRWEEYARWNEDEVSRFQVEIETVRQEVDRWQNDAQRHEKVAAQLRSEAEKAQRTIQRLHHEEEHRRGQLELLQADAAMVQQELALLLADAEHDQQEVANWCVRAERIRREAKRWKTAAEVQRLDALSSRKSVAELQSEAERWQAIAEINQSEAERCQATAENSRAEAEKWRQQAAEQREATERLWNQLQEARLELARRPEVIVDSVLDSPKPLVAASPDHCERKTASTNAADAIPNLLQRRREELARLAQEFVRAEVERAPTPPEPIADSEVEPYLEVNEEGPVELEIELVEVNVTCVETTEQVSTPDLELIAEPELDSQFSSEPQNEGLDREATDTEVDLAESFVEDNATSLEADQSPTVVDEPSLNDATAPEQQYDEDGRCDRGEQGDAENVLVHLNRAGSWRDSQTMDSAVASILSEPSEPDVSLFRNATLLELAEESEADGDWDSTSDIEDGEETLALEISAVPAGGPADDSIECYMERLLQRVRGSQVESAVVQRRSRDPERRPVTEADLDLETPVDPSEPVLLTESEYMPRSQAPEGAVDLRAMRAIGNERRQKDILIHAKRMYSNKTRFNFAGAVLGVAVACGSCLYLNTYPECAAIGLLAGSGTALYWLLQANRLWKQLFGSLRLNTEELHGKCNPKNED